MALIKADCGILLNSAPIKTWHCLKHFDDAELSEGTCSVFIKQQVQFFLFGDETGNKLFFSLVHETDFHTFVFFFFMQDIK